MGISKKLRFEVFKRDNFSCTYCGATAPIRLEVDHIHPRCQGGSDNLANLTTACFPCNRGKSGTPLPPAVEPPVVFQWQRQGGPWDGRYRETESSIPYLWMLRDGEGTLHECYDELEYEDGELTCYPASGHPGVCGRKGREFDFHEIYNRTGFLKVIGAYLPRVWEENFSVGIATLTWWDTDRIILDVFG